MAGVCYGYELETELDLRFVRPGDAVETLRVTESDREDRGSDGEPVRSWTPTAERPFDARLFAEKEGWRLWISDLGSYHVDPARRAIEVPPVRTIQREARLWGIPTVLCFTHRGDHSLHAASVDLGGRALAFGAPGRFGKTTMATALIRHGGRLLAEDSTCIRLEGDGASVLPGPAMLRVRPEPTDRAEPIPGTEVVGRDADRIHLAVTEDRRGDAAPVPLAGIVLLRPSKDGVRIEDVPSQGALQDLWTLSFSVPTDDDRARCFDRLARLASTVPIWNLHRPLRFDALDEVARAVRQLAG
jgi:hypothetical protein